MTRESIVESNRLIAEFMGSVKKDDGLDDCFILDGTAYHEWDLRFHSSWDWLMPVVERIITLDIEPFSLGGYMQANINDNLIQGIGVAHKTVVEFIKWYNQNK